MVTSDSQRTSSSLGTRPLTLCTGSEGDPCTRLWVILRRRACSCDVARMEEEKEKEGMEDRGRETANIIYFDTITQ